MSTEHTDDNVLILTEQVEGTGSEPRADGSDVQESENHEAQIWAFQGVHGGAGVTSLAIDAAYELASGFGKAREQGANTLLIDLDFERGDCSTYMDIQPSMRIEELNAAVGRMDPALAKTFTKKYSDTLSVIIAESELGGNDHINPAALLSLLDQVATEFDYIVLDVPQLWRTWTQAIIGAVDKFILISVLTVPALHKTNELSASITQKMDLDNPPTVLINKYERRTMRHGVHLKDAEKVLQRDDLITICTDEDTLRHSINSGQPAGKLKPDSRYAKAVREVVRAWAIDGAADQTAEHEELDRRLQRA